MMEQVVNRATRLPRPSVRPDADLPLGPAATEASEAWRRRLDRFVAAAAVAACLLAIGHYAAVVGASRAVMIDFHPLNGDFQNFNPVRRMFAGQRPGRDFDSYLGLGPVCTLYLAMLPLGPDFASSLFATHMLHALSAAGAVVLLCRLCRLSWSWSCLLAWFALVYARSPGPLPTDGILHPILSELAQPGNSSLGLRCLAPLLAAVGMLWVFRAFGFDRARDVRYAGFCLGGIGGLLLPWSNDHGLSATMALLLVGGLWLYRRAATRLAAVQAIAAMLAAAAVSAFVVLLAISAGNPGQWYAYNFQNVAKDQYWYFVGSKITTLYDIPLYRGVLIALGCLGLLTWRIRRASCRPEEIVLLFLLLSNLLAGYISVSGAISDRYFFPLYRCLMVVAPCLALRGIVRVLDLSKLVGGHGRKLAAVTAGALIVGGLFAVQDGYRTMNELKTAAADALLPVPELGGAINHTFSKVFAVGCDIRMQAQAAGASDQQRLFSTYATAMDVVAGASHATRSDYIIHALGPQRRREYVERFTQARPMFVTTIRDDYTHWEKWVRTVNWDFYAQLLKTYRPMDRTPYNVVWQRRSEPAVWPDIALETAITQVADGQVQLAIHFPQATEGASNERHFVEVEIEYDWHWKPGRLRRGDLRPYLIARDEARPDGWGVPPYETTCRFPIELAPSETRVVSLTCQPLDGVGLAVRRCTARVLLPKSQVDGFRLSRLRASTASNTHWTNGIWKADARAGLAVVDASDLHGLQAGSRLRFRASGERVVANIAGSIAWLHGAPLDPVEDGYPHVIEIVP